MTPATAFRFLHATPFVRTEFTNLKSKLKYDTFTNTCVQASHCFMFINLQQIQTLKKNCRASLQPGNIKFGKKIGCSVVN